MRGRNQLFGKSVPSAGSATQGPAPLPVEVNWFGALAGVPSTTMGAAGKSLQTSQRRGGASPGSPLPGVTVMLPPVPLTPMPPPRPASGLVPAVPVLPLPPEPGVSPGPVPDPVAEQAAPTARTKSQGAKRLVMSTP